MCRPNIVAIIGTTGVGKSKLSISLAKLINGEIINGDSMQMYEGLDTVTNKHPVAERQDVRHHLLGHVRDLTSEYSAVQFEGEAERAAQDILGRQKVPVLVGGTHYYIQKFLFRQSSLAGERDLTAEEARFLDDAPTAGLFARLREIDPVIAAKFHPRDRRKLRRALEICLATGRRTSEVYAGQDRKNTARYRTLIFWLWAEPDQLNARLCDRVEDMYKGKLMDELRAMAQLYDSITPKPDLERGVWQVIGFKEFLPHIDGDEASGLSEMKRVTVKYASSQVRWIRRKLLVAAANEPDVTVVLLDATDLSRWTEAVEQRAVAITQDFLAGKEIEPRRRAPADHQHLLTPLQEQDYSARQESWKHVECDVCVDKGAKFVCMGEQQWQAHLRSRRHRQTLKHAREKEAFEKWKASKLITG